MCATTPNGNQPALPELPAADLEGALGDAKLPCFTLGMSDPKERAHFCAGLIHRNVPAFSGRYLNDYIFVVEVSPRVT